MRLLPVLAISIASLTLVGCSTTTPQAIPTSSAVEQASAFSSDEEALAAAQAAYAEYLSVSDQIARDGGSNPERLQKLTSKKQYEIELGPLMSISESGGRMEGESSFDSIHLQDYSNSSVSAYLCLDNSAVSLVKADGTRETPEVLRWPLIVNFERSNSGKFVLSGSETWTGENFC